MSLQNIFYAQCALHMNHAASASDFTQAEIHRCLGCATQNPSPNSWEVCMGILGPLVPLPASSLGI